MENFIKSIRLCKDKESASRILYQHANRTKNINLALKFAEKYHHNQLRKSGHPYIIHPILVASIVAYLGGDEDMIIASLLHDIVEDTDCELFAIENIFGSTISSLVSGLTNITEIRKDELPKFVSDDEKFIKSALSFRNMILTSIKDIRLLIIKLSDRLHNMLTLYALSYSKQKKISKETLFVYAPIAHRLGIYFVKNILEDVSFFYLFPKQYHHISNFINEKEGEFNLRLNAFIAKIEELLLKNNFCKNDFKILKRIKHYYSIYLKMQRKGISISEILDLLAIRVIVDDPIDCYRVLGIIHLNFNPLIVKLKDYIAIPKSNGYKAIHTMVIDEKFVVEVQIRTKSMDFTAEYGLAAHWKYKEGETYSQHVKWLDDIKEQDELNKNNIENFYNTIRSNLYSKDVAVFSPKGELYTLPRGSTVLDFAYAVHTDIGNHSEAAYANEYKVSLLSEIKNGDIINIQTANEPILKCSWVNYVKTPKAKNAIKAICKSKIKELNFKIVRNKLLSIFGISESRFLQILRENSIKNIDRACDNTRYFQYLIYKFKGVIIKNIGVYFPFIKFNKYKLKRKVLNSVEIFSVYNVSSYAFSFCCIPKNGDPIMAFIKKDEALIHNKFCTRAQKAVELKKPMVFVRWLNAKDNIFRVLIILENKKGALASFLKYLTKMDINILTINHIVPKSEDSSDHFKLVLELPRDISSDKIKMRLKSKCKILEFTSQNDAYLS